MSIAEVVIILMGLGVIITVLKVLKGAIKLVLTGFLIIFTCCVLVIYVPESKLSMALTSAIAQHITIDLKQEYGDGYLIAEFELSSIELDSKVLTAITRHTARAAAKTKIDELALKDAIIYFNSTSETVEISIYKVE